MASISRSSVLEGSFQANLLQDHHRLNAYAEAIAAVVRPGDVVADIGSGSGILAHLAAKAGATRVYAIETLPKTFKFLQRTLKANSESSQVIAIQDDGVTWTPPETIDVVICELMETGLLHEPMAAVVRAVSKWPARPRAIVPGGARLCLRLIDAWTDYHGYRVQNAGFQAKARRLLSRPIPYATYDFVTGPPGPNVDATIEVPVTTNGTATAIRLETTALVAPGITARPSARHCTPLVLTMDQPIAVREGDRLQVRLRYSFSFDAEPIHFDVATIRQTPL